jgi:hypothetical protein
LTDATPEAAAHDSAETEASAGAETKDRRERYGALLLAILVAFGVQGVAKPGKVEQVVVSALLAATLLLALWAGDARPRVKRGAVIIAVAVVIASIIQSANGNINGASIRLANLLLVTLAPPAIILGVVRSVRSRQRVTVPAVFGVLCLYLLLGMFFAFVYGSIDRLAGHDFFAENVAATVSNCLYFSFTTLTTVGYGNLVPATAFGQSLAMVEAVAGQIFLIVVVARLVSLWGQYLPARAPRSESTAE